MDEQLAKLKEQECAVQLANSTNKLNGLYCPGRFDGWTCWPHTPAGEVANHSCPADVIGFDATKYVQYKCENDGNWIFNEGFNRTWVNYTTCVNVDDLLFRKTVMKISSALYGISLVALLISLALLFYFKSLRCARILIHMNLFASFAINNFLWIIMNYVSMEHWEIIEENSLWCTMLREVVFTFLISNYSWMLCEGLYLHTVLVWAFISEKKLFKWMLLIGWGIPIIDTLLYVPIRLTLGNEEELLICWENDSRFDFIQQVPVVVAIILNFLFLINIVRVLVTKLRRGPANDGSGIGTSRSSLQALRATLLLFPLLGLTYLLIPFRPSPGHPMEMIYEYVSSITTSSQGLCVAILFCFCNGEVQGQIKRKWRTVMFRPRANSCTVTTVSFVRSTYPTNGEEKV